MKVPESVKIGPFRFGVIRKAALASESLRTLDGNIEFAEGRINIREGQSADHEVATFFHECVHGIDYYMNIGLEEQQIDSIANGLLSFLRDNNLLRDDAPLLPTEASQEAV